MNTASTVPRKGAQRSQFHRVRAQEHVRYVEKTCELLDSKKQGTESRVPCISFFVPSLVSLCADTIAANFEVIPEVDALADSYPELYEMVIERLSTELPLKVSVQRVHCEKFWRRCSESRWSFGQLSEGTRGKLVGGTYRGWKQFFLERLLRDFLMGLKTAKPSENDEQQLLELCNIGRDYIYSLELPCQTAHLDVYGMILSRLPHVLNLSLTYSVNNVEVGFEWDMIGFTEDDALSIRYVLRRYTPLVSLRLPNNRIDSSLLKGIISGIVQNTSIKVLDFSFNRIDDEGAKSLALLLCKEDLPLEELYLNDNGIRGEGAAAIADALTLNKRLRLLNLRLNRIPDDVGGVALVAGLASHSALEALDISHNLLGEATARALAEILPSQNSLLSLNIAGNRDLGVNTGELLLKGLKENKSLRFFDSRGSGLSLEHVAAMERQIRSVVQSEKMNDIQARDKKSREIIHREVEEKLSKIVSVR
ncbi:hypothetical protein, conserved [Trypanosoma brucei gambiense DAL972]|uniref:Leucine-rich repeat protein (LRRP) n=1 Tax=Trypanosoma brucei gambiense (strain MHOM/CI/86/DAL972) TaxID=679716 RepID=C9ZP54_TRYB9|nr:hypothetical protein, conserved [Trypanosoma brucei gambiense DAL972]CBH11182.1 hypothetical protein, conserved [Trypanosoma brucei gambiense DAL972]|eukprot:XP_011773469.1 hypothetical protein, conserved [Trypanosoma brucei gambiense DAL972]